MFEDRKEDGSGGYMSDGSSGAYEKELAEREEEEKKRNERRVAVISPNVQTPPPPEPEPEADPQPEPEPERENDSDSSGSDAIPLADYVQYLSRSTLIVLARQALDRDNRDSDTPPPFRGNNNR